MIQEKKYGGITLFVGFVTLISAGLTAYYIYFIRIFEKINQVYDAIPANSSLVTKILYKYLAIYDAVFGKTPSTPVLAVFIPLTLILIIFFLDYLIKYVKQKSREKKLSKEEAVFNDQSTIQG